MQRVTNCVIHQNGNVLLMQKPRRGWWYSPGGKVSTCETIYEAVQREVQEETGLQIHNPELKAIMTIVIQEGEQVVDEWMLFTFYADAFSGTLQPDHREGVLKWVPMEVALTLPMPKGDKMVLQNIRIRQGVTIGRCIYTPNYELLSYTIHEPSLEIR